MLDREQVLTVLRRRFPESTATQVATAANLILGLEDGWTDVTVERCEHGRPYLVFCCGEAERAHAAEFRILRRHPRAVQVDPEC